ncbi:exodeoxyribonuclease V subunit gamma [Colwelliaceae bacterium 6441]
MIYLYPANKMENLLALVDKIQQISPLPIFSKEVFIVQNAGMQHWLNMSIAESRGISLSVDYALPAQYLWKLIRSLVNKDLSVDQSPFSREAMCWRIYQLLGENCVLEDNDFLDVTRYWQENAQGQQQESINGQKGRHKNLKRYQLACQLADLFEQYLVFRPDWMDVWQSGDLNQSSLASEQNAHGNFSSVEKWQAKLWLLLTQSQDYNPIKLLEQATGNLSIMTHTLPKRLCFFGLNAMAPMWLSFINALSEVIDVHFFHLNPCENYWGDILSEKQAFKGSEKWTQVQSSISDSVGNPLLANLGQQGREFLSLLQQYSMVNIEAFESTKCPLVVNNSSILSHVQEDILSLRDARTSPSLQKDDSIVITSAHSALREVQGLHDWLLHQFNQDKTLKPRDVLVMCPQVEKYAPYVNAVFSKGWQELKDDIPPLPCSISDRISLDTEPLVTAFSELLTLPDSRFQVSQILAWLRLPALQAKFGLQIEDIDKFTLWIESACIHWGIDAEHKKKILNSNNVAEQFTWQYGLSRLLQGFAYSDQAVVHGELLLLPNVEGSDAILLGKLMLVFEQLQYFTAQLNRARSPHQWHKFLKTLIDDVFDSSNEDSFSIIFSAIESFVEYCQHASFEQEIELCVLREYLTHHFSQPDTGRQFMVGQVTFCSMLPMRSIPFKIVAVLGLNDGDFPRQRTPLAFDLMSLTKSRLGDRSRRGDDRYLFLEAIISARQSLYLSYLGRSIKNNNERQPSIVLKELMDYLSQSYGWKLLGDDPSDIRQLAMQPYSEKNYLGQYAGFDAKWLALSPTRAKAVSDENPRLCLSDVDQEKPSSASISDSIETAITSLELVRFFVHPSRYFAQKKLGLYLDNAENSLNDVEPFDSDHLSRYLLKEHALAILLQDNGVNRDDDNLSTLIHSLKKEAALSGKFPQLPHQSQQLDKLINDSVTFSAFIQDNISNLIEDFTIDIALAFDLEINGKTIGYEVALSTQLQVVSQQLIAYRSSLPKMKDFLEIYINLLIVQVWLQQNNEEELADNNLRDKLTENFVSHGYYFDSKSQKTVHYCYPQLEQAKERLIELVNIFLLGQEEALLLNAELAQVFLKAKVFEQSDFEHFWTDDNNRAAFGKDPYIHYFWRHCPNFSEISSQLEQVYLTLHNNREQVKK